MLRRNILSYSGFPGYTTSYLAAPSPAGDRHASPTAIYATDLGAAQTSQLTAGGLQIQRSEPSPQPNTMTTSPLQRVSEQLINAQRAQGLSGMRGSNDRKPEKMKTKISQLEPQDEIQTEKKEHETCTNVRN